MLVEALPAADYVVDSEAAFADKLGSSTEEMQNAGLEPMLFVADRFDIERRWRRHLLEAKDRESHALRMTKDAAFTYPGYLAHINAIPAIEMDIARGLAFLLPKECFERLEFKRQPDGRPSRLEVEERTPQQVGLSLIWGARVTLKPFPTFRFVFDTSRSNEPPS